VTAIVFGATAAIGALISAAGLAAAFRAVRPIASPTLPAQPAGRLVLEGTPRRRWIPLLGGLGLLCLIASIGVGVLGALESRASVAVVVVATLLVMVAQLYLERRFVDRLVLDEDAFRLGQQGEAVHRWVHVTDFRADEDVIRFRLNRALVRGSHWRYWDGTIRNRWGVETRQLLRLLERYRERAMETAPSYLTGKSERSRS